MRERNPIVSIITPLYAPRAAFIEETARAVTAQTFTDFEWLVQEDGDQPEFAARMTGMPAVQYAANGRQLGIATTRNLALARARGRYIVSLDHDDVLVPTALERLVGELDANPNARWAVGRADDLLANGDLRVYEHPHEIAPGDVAPGALFDRWYISRRLPVHTVGVIVHAAALRRDGGWPALPAADDVAMLLTVSQRFPGRFIDETLMHYRKWPGQTSSDPTYVRLRPPSYRAIEQRVATLTEQPPAVFPRLVSVVSTVRECDRPYVAEAYDSLCAQELPPGWSWEWCVSETSDAATMQEQFAADPRVRVDATSSQLHRAHGRNCALTRARGQYTVALNACDVLRPGALWTLIAALERDPDVAWVGARADDLHDDGTTSAVVPVMTAGRVELGTLDDHWQQGVRWPIHPGCFAVRTTEFRAVGGWPAVPFSEESLALHALNACHKGLLLDQVVFEYRLRTATRAGDADGDDDLLSDIDRVSEQRTAAWQGQPETHS